MFQEEMIAERDVVVVGFRFRIMNAGDFFGTYP
jgi:hypothetical protein